MNSLDPTIPNLIFETLLTLYSKNRAALVPEAAVFQRISDLSKTLRQPPRQEQLQFLNTKSNFKNPSFQAIIAVSKTGF